MAGGAGMGAGPWQPVGSGRGPRLGRHGEGPFRQRFRPRWEHSEMVGAGGSLSTARRALGTPRTEGVEESTPGGELGAVSHSPDPRPGVARAAVRPGAPPLPRRAAGGGRPACAPLLRRKCKSAISPERETNQRKQNRRSAGKSEPPLFSKQERGVGALGRVVSRHPGQGERSPGGPVARPGARVRVQSGRRGAAPMGRGCPASQPQAARSPRGARGPPLPRPRLHPAPPGPRLGL